MERLLESWVIWEPCGDEQAAEAMGRLARAAPEIFAEAKLLGSRAANLPFYGTHRLIELHLARHDRPEWVFVLHGPEETRWLDGESEPIHETNAAESLALTDATVHDYVRFFFAFVHSDSGAFVLIESPSDVTADHEADPPEQVDGTAEPDPSELRKRIASIRSRVTPLTTRTIDESGRWVIDSAVAFLDTLFSVTLAVAPDGEVEMTDDEEAESLDGISVPEGLSLRLVFAQPEPGRDSSPGDFAVSDEPVALPRDRDVAEAIVAVLLEDAIRERDSKAVDSHTLLGHFNSETGRDKPIDRLTRLVSNSVPVIIIESDLPFVEDFVAGLIDGPNQVVTGGAVVRAGAFAGDEIRCMVEYESSRTKLHLLSFHAYRGLYDAERTAHELALRDAAVLIGCERAADVPEPLRRIADLTLTFPRIDRQRFARIFKRVFQAKPTPGWDAPGADSTTAGSTCVPIPLLSPPNEARASMRRQGRRRRLADRSQRR